MNAPATASRPSAVSAFLAKSHRLLIGDAWADAQSGKTIDVIDPATGKTIAHAAAGAKADIDKAVKAARKAFEPWANTLPDVRAKLLWKLAELIEANGQELSYLETLDNGMPITMAGWVPTFVCNLLRYNAGWAGKIGGDTLTLSTPNQHAYTLREPVGVVGAIVPWNFPLGTTMSKLAPALAAGCTVVLKPAELTPLSSVRLGELIQEAGFPEGVVNIVTGYGPEAGQALVDHPDVDKISFTGSTRVGKSILAAAAGNLKRVSLELGGKSPVLIFPDADLDQAAMGAAMGVFLNSGQVCVAGSRLFIHKKVFDRVVDGVAQRAAALKLGPGIDPKTEIGPLVSEKQRQRVTGYIETGMRDGGEIVVGGKTVGDAGYFVQPTVFINTSPKATINRDEIFGPVVCAMPFDDDDLDRIAATANDTDYGLSSYIWTKNVSLVHKLARKLKAGGVRVNGGAGLDPNMPFGGYKQSGWGRENGRAGIEAFTEIKSVSIAL